MQRALLVLMVFAVFCLLSLSPASASEGEARSDVPPQTGPVQPYLRKHFEMRKEVDASRGYRTVDEAEKVRLFQAQDQLFGLLGEVRNFEDLSAEQREQLDRIHEELLPAMASVRDQEVICRRERPTSSRIKETKCFTRAELARIELRAERDTDRRSHTGQSERIPNGVGMFPILGEDKSGAKRG